MKKALILSVADKRHMTMASTYIEYFQTNSIPYDIVRTSRYSKGENFYEKTSNCNTYEYTWKAKHNATRFSKLKEFIKFKLFAYRIIKSNSYDFIVVWNENTAILFSDILLLFGIPYCVNVRDQYNTNNKLIHFLGNTARKRAVFETVVSPDEKLRINRKSYCLFNRDNQLLKLDSSIIKNKFSSSYPINIVYMGFYSAAPDTFKRIIDIFSNDDRYVLHFYGEGCDVELGSYCRERNIHNVLVGGAFEYEKTALYLKKADIINTYYNNFDTNPGLKNACGIKMSYTPLIYIPAIVDKDTTWGRICLERNVGFTVDENNLNSLPDDLDIWIKNIDFEMFKKQCNEINKMISESILTVYSEMDGIFI